jgi:hypothetical protein
MYHILTTTSQKIIGTFWNRVLTVAVWHGWAISQWVNVLLTNYQHGYNLSTVFETDYWLLMDVSILTLTDSHLGRTVLKGPCLVLTNFCKQNFVHSLFHERQQQQKQKKCITSGLTFSKGRRLTDSIFWRGEVGGRRGCYLSSKTPRNKFEITKYRGWNLKVLS